MEERAVAPGEAGHFSGKFELAVDGRNKIEFEGIDVEDVVIAMKRV